MKKPLLLSLFVVIVCFTKSWAQCNTGETPIYLHFYTDAWGEENYWELVPSDSSCGNSTIDWGANETVGCAGNDPNNGDEGYIDNAITIVGPYCLSIGLSYDVIFVDSYGDGGLDIAVFEDQALMQIFEGQGDGNVWTYTVGETILEANDSPCNAIALEINGGPIECNNLNAIAALDEPNPAGGPCGLPGAWCDNDANATNSIWYSFVASTNTTYEITTCNDVESFDTQLALYSSSNCADFSTYELISSNDDMIGGCPLTNGFASKMFASCLEDGMTYYIQLDGWQGDEGSTSLSISTIESVLSLEAYVHDVNCPLDKGDEGSGAIEVYIQGTSSNFTSTWTGPNGFTSAENWVNNLDPGVYSVEVTEACGETFTDTYEITLPDYWEILITQEQPSCEQSSDGAMSISINGATSPFECNWMDPNEDQLFGLDLTNLSFGSYNYYIEDDNGCQFEGQINLAPSNSFTFDLGDPTTLCLDDTEVVSGPLDCDYVWQDGSTNQFFTIDAEDYGVGSSYSVILSATNGLGCVFADAFIFAVEDCNSVAEQGIADLIFFPNPVQHEINLKWGDRRTSGQWYIFDAAGQVVLNDRFVDANQITQSLNLASGYYFMLVKTQGSETRIPFVVQK